MDPMLLLITGATGKVGRRFLEAFVTPENAHHRVRALCHKRPLEPGPNLEVMRGNMADRATARAAMAGVTHVLHLATCKETPDDVIDVTVKGLFFLLEEARLSATFKQFILIGGDAAVGHCDQPYDSPITEASPRKAYQGCYALSKVLEEAMLEQYYHQYDLNGCCLRASWIMEKDDFRCVHSFGDDSFGETAHKTHVGPIRAAGLARRETIPLFLDHAGTPLTRNFVALDDLVAAIQLALGNPRARQQLFNISMDPPVNYAALARHLKQTRGLDAEDIPTGYHSNWLDVSKARHILGWQPRIGMGELVETSWNYQRKPSEERVIHYPG